MKNKRKGSPKPEVTRKRRAKNLSNNLAGVNSALSKEFPQNANFRDTDDQDNVPDLEGIYIYKSDLRFK